MAVPFRKNTLHILTGSILTAFLVSGCGESSSSSQGEQFGTNTPAPSTSFNQNTLLQSLADNVIVPTYTDFSEFATAQATAIDTYCEALTDNSQDTSNALQNAQQSWRNAMASWQMAEVMQLGPLIENNNSLRNKIYSWPNTSTCAVDQDVVLAEAAGYNIATRTATRKGLDALDYLLFNQELNHSCTVFGTEPVGWNNRTDEDRQAARCSYAQLVSADLVTHSQDLLNAWNGANGYAEILKNAGQQGSQFSDVHDAVNDVSDALFYIDTLTKDAKVATPLGLFANDCGLSPCTQNTESQFAMHSLENVLANMRALRLIFAGGDSAQSIGFDDYLVDVGDADTANKMRMDLDEAIQFAETLQQSLQNLLDNDADQVEQLHGHIKDVTDTMKTDFIQSLALELPATSAGDND